MFLFSIAGYNFGSTSAGQEKKISSENEEDNVETMNQENARYRKYAYSLRLKNKILGCFNI